MGIELYDDYILEHLNERGFSDIKELHKYINDYIFHCSNKLYEIQGKYYRMSAIDAYRYEVRLQEIDFYGELILGENLKVFSRKMNIEKFEEIAKIYNLK